MPRQLTYLYESPIEQRLGERIDHWLHIDTELHFQVRCTVGDEWVNQRFRIDMLLVGLSGRKVAIEADGAAYHQDRIADQRRDRCLISDGMCDVVYHFSGRSIMSNVDACILALAQNEPSMFTAKAAHYALDAVASNFWMSGFNEMDDDLFNEQQRGLMQI